MMGGGNILLEGSSANRAILWVTDVNGNINTNFGTNGYYIGPENTSSRQFIKVSGSSTIQYVFIGQYIDNGNYDAWLVALSATGNVVWEKRFDEQEMVNNRQYVDLPGDETECNNNQAWESNDQDGWDVLQGGNHLFLSCKFDWSTISTNCAGFVYQEIALIEVAISDGGFINAVDVGVTEAKDYFPDIEIKDGQIYLLGVHTYLENNEPKTDGKLSIFNTSPNLVLTSEKTFKNDNWELNCPFDIIFDCDGQVIVSANNEFDNSNNEEDEDYVFYKFSNDCQTNIQLGSNDVSAKKTVQGTENWNSSLKVKASVIVPNGTTLNINSGTVIEFGASWDLVDYDILSQNGTAGLEPRIVVESGGTLNLNDCILRGMSECATNSMWDGIEIQYGGTLNLNGATIQDAKFGILADRGNYDSNGRLKITESSGGGTINANGGIIQNCDRGIHFAAGNYGSSTVISNALICSSALKDPDYKSIVYQNNYNYPQGNVGVGTSIFISANNATVTINDGSITNTAFLPPNMRGTGISTFNSLMTVTGGIDISNLNIGILAQSNDIKKFLTVSAGNTFNGNQTGIRFVSGGMHQVMSNNTFDCTYPNIPNQSQYGYGAGIGIYNASSVGVKIFDNNTFMSSASGSNAGTIGILNHHTLTMSCTHQNNIFNNLTFGEQTQLVNKGLNLWCNKHNNNTKAWNVNPLSPGNFKDQGTCLPNNSIVPQNEFHDPTCQLPLNHIQSTKAFTYWTIQNEPYTPICNSSIVSTPTCVQQNIRSGCTEPIPLTPGNVDYYFGLVSGLPEGTERELIVNDLIRYYVDHNNSEKIHTILQNETGENYNMYYALLLLNEGNITGAQIIVNNLPSNSSETVSFQEYFSVLVYAKTSNLELSELPINKISDLEVIASGTSHAAYSSQAILTTYYGKSFQYPVETESGTEYRTKEKEFVTNTESLIMISPNPANSVLDLKLANSNSLIIDIDISSLDGKLVPLQLVNHSNVHNKISIEHLNAGIYLIRVLDNAGRVSKSKFVKL